MTGRISTTLIVGSLALGSPCCSSSLPTGGTVGASDVIGPDGPVCTSCGDCEQHLAVPSANHVLGNIDYADNPPAGGNHNPCWATWGIHDDVVPAENWVHNLEHGGIVFLYKPGAGPDAGAPADFTTLVEQLPRTLLTAYPALPKAFAVVSWGHRLVSDCLDEKAAKAFYDEHFDQGPESIPDNPSCN